MKYKGEFSELESTVEKTNRASLNTADSNAIESKPTHIYEYWLDRIEDLSANKKRLLVSYLKGAKQVYSMEGKQLREMSFLGEKDHVNIHKAKQASTESLREEYEKMIQKQIRFIPWGTPLYPEKLYTIPNPPFALYVKGNLPNPKRKTVAIVGARKCTSYGEHYALAFGKWLAECQVQIISGLALGIDGSGQRGAILGGGVSFGVLGCGVDICYPREHIELYADTLQKGGGILSEYPPGIPPIAYHFPHRNRIISGLSDVILVMEAKMKSGSLITADTALEQGRDVYALPGSLANPLSQGCNWLISQGAGILLSPEKLVEDLGISIRQYDENSDKSKKELESFEQIVYSRLCFYPKRVDDLIVETGLRAEQIMEQLISLELQGLICEISKNNYTKK